MGWRLTCAISPTSSSRCDSKYDFSGMEEEVVGACPFVVEARAFVDIALRPFGDRGGFVRALRMFTK